MRDAGVILLICEIIIILGPAAQADKAMSFNRDEAEKNRKWQEYMSSTAHQRGERFGRCRS